MWWAIASQILGDAANQYQGIRNTLEGPAKRRRFLGDAARDAQVTALRNQRHTNFFPTNAIDAVYKAQQVRREARENPAFQADPAAFLPFVQSATNTASSIYDELNKPSAPKAPQPTPEQLTKFEPASTYGPASAAFHRPRRRMGLVER